jgi:hypothetical protein
MLDAVALLTYFQGKTDVAMLAVLRVLNQYRDTRSTSPIASTIDRNKFKIIYVSVELLQTWNRLTIIQRSHESSGIRDHSETRQAASMAVDTRARAHRHVALVLNQR